MSPRRVAVSLALAVVMTISLLGQWTLLRIAEIAPSEITFVDLAASESLFPAASIILPAEIRAELASHVPSLPEGSCKHIFFDIGANKGMHSRFLFEAARYPTPGGSELGKFQKWVTKYMGGEEVRSLPSALSGVCLFGMEANPEHKERLMALQRYLHSRGFQAYYFVPYAAWSDRSTERLVLEGNDTDVYALQTSSLAGQAAANISSSLAGQAAANISSSLAGQAAANISSSLAGQAAANISSSLAGQAAANVSSSTARVARAIWLADFFNFFLQTYQNKSAQDKSVVVKMDIEGAEWDVLNSLPRQQVCQLQAQSIDVLLIEWHDLVPSYSQANSYKWTAIGYHKPWLLKGRRNPFGYIYEALWALDLRWRFGCTRMIIVGMDNEWYSDDLPGNSFAHLEWDLS